MAAQTPLQDAHPRKRSRLSPEHSTEPSMSDAPAATGPTDATDPNTDSESELSESSEEPSDLSSSDDDDDDDEDNAGQDNEATQMEVDQHEKQEEVVNLRANRGKKPAFKLSEDEVGPDIRSFLKDFLPQLKAANEELEAQRKAGTLKKREIDAVDAEEDKEYIEMNLGLGVLKMKDADADSSESESDESDTENAPKEKDILGKLMGQEKTKDAVGIQEVQDKPGS